MLANSHYFEMSHLKNMWKLLYLAKHGAVIKCTLVGTKTKELDKYYCIGVSDN